MAASDERRRLAQGAALHDPSPTNVLTPERVGSSIAWAAHNDQRLHALLSLLVFDGLKMGEALAVDVDDVSGRPPRVQLANGCTARSGASC